MPLAARRGRVLDHEPARARRRRPAPRIGRGVVVERHQPARRRLALGPRRDVEVARRAARLNPHLEALREARRAAPRGRSAGRRTPRAGWSSTPARSGGKSAAAQSALIPIPTTTRGSSVPRPSLSPRTPASLRRSTGDARRAAAASRVQLADRAGRSARATSITRSFGHLSRIAPTGRPGGVLGGVGHRERDGRGQPPGPVGRRATSGGSRARPAARHRAAPSTSGRGARGPRSARRRPRGRPPARRPPASRGRRRWSTRWWRTARRGRTRRARRRSRSRALSRRRRRPPRRSRAARARTRRGGRGRPPPRGPRR